MKKFVIILIIYFISNNLYANNLFESFFFEVEFSSNNIEEKKIQIINELKHESIKIIFKKTLLNKNYKNIKNNLTTELINTFIKNIIINDEKIINNNYQSKIKINFEKKKIIDYFRKNKIPYLEYHPENFLLIIYEEDEINNNLFTKNNNFYSYIIDNPQINNIFLIPNLDVNDRYLLNKTDIKKKDVQKINSFSNKYKSNQVIIVNVIKKENIQKYDLFLYSDGVILEKKLTFEDFKYEIFFDKIEKEALNLWKEINKIQNQSLNFLNCNLSFFNIFELKEIRVNLNKISIIESLNIKSLSYKNIEYDIFYYGDYNILINILDLNNLIIHNENSNCKIGLK